MTQSGAGGTLTLKDSGSGEDIKVGKNGIGIYAQDSDVKMDGNYGIEVQEGGVALQSEGNTIISRTNAADKLTVDYAGASGTGKTAIGIAFKGVAGNTFNNSMNMEVLNTGGAETIVGIYGTGAGTLTNSGDITAQSTGSYGIISEGVDVVNTGVVTVGDSLVPVSGAIGIYVKDASVDAVGKDIVIQGNGDSSTSTHPIGIYAKSSIAGNREIKVTNGATPMSVAGKAGIGIYVEDTIGTALKLNSSSDITLGNSSAVADRRFGIFMTNAKNTANETNGIITVGENNIGIYSKDSILKNSGTINVTHNASGTENIGIHNVTDSGNITLDAKGIGAYFIDTDVTNSGNVAVNIADGYGMYFKGGDSSSTGTITATGNNSAGVIVTQAGAEFTNSIGGTINSGGTSSIGVYAEDGATFTNAGTLNSTLLGGSIGAFAKGSTIENMGTIGSHYLGLYGKDASTVNYTSGTMTVNSGVGILVDGLAINC